LKKECAGCKAFEGRGCTLHYQTKEYWVDDKVFTGFEVYRQRPLEDCPKPRSTKKLYELLIKKNLVS